MTYPPVEQWYKEYKRLLFSIAYRMLGSVSEAEDIVHDLFLDLPGAVPDDIGNVKAYLCKAVTHRCINYLHSARVRREQYIGPWLPEPLLYEAASEGDDPLWRAERKDDISFAFLLLLERLTSVERAIFVLREAFDYDYRDIAEMLDRSEAACRKTFSRLKNKLEEERPRTPLADSPSPEALTYSFLQAVDTGDVHRFVHLLTEDAAVYSDGGGKVRAAIRPILGPDRVAAFLLGIAAKRTDQTIVHPAVINGSPGIVLSRDGVPFSIFNFEFRGEKLHRIYIINNPDKLRHVHV